MANTVTGLVRDGRRDVIQLVHSNRDDEVVLV